MKFTKEIFNREISWLSFNHRVLQEADDSTVPLIERIKFLGIFSNNLDEFFKVRVATIKRMVDLGIKSSKVTAEKPKLVLDQIQQIVRHLQEQFGIIYNKILKELEKENIFIINEKQLSKKEGDFIKFYFHENILPVLSTVMLKPSREFPYMKDKSIYLAAKLCCNEKKQADYALIEIPAKGVTRFIVLPKESNKTRIILIDDVIRYCLSDVFSMFNYKYHEAYTIKLTRDAVLDIDNDLSQSFVEKISKSVKSRSKGQAVRFLYDADIPNDLLEYIYNELQFDTNDSLIGGGRYHNFKDFMQFPNLDKPHLENKKYPALKHKLLKSGKNILDVIKKQDIILHYPYHSFTQYIDLLREASIDPKVKEIRHTVYRVKDDSKVVNALINAARNGKKVIVNIELQARFDEETNIYWSKKLEEVGAKVLFGIPTLKIHAKLCIITRKEDNKLVDYACVGSGNFHEGTAKVYTDMTLFTANKKITDEVKKIFDYFENTYQNYSFRNLLVAPLNLRKKITSFIDAEIKNAKEGKPAYITAKINSLIDIELIYKLYQASNAGVKIKLLSRGNCSLVPGIKGQSENIEVISIVDKYLEHLRVYVFCNNNDELYYISSADWMPRNLDSRVEVACPVYDKNLKKEIKDILEIQLKDNVKARIVNDEQNNDYKKTKSKEKIRSQIEIYNYYKKRDS